MLEAGIEVVLESQCQYHLEVRVVYVCIDAEESFEDGLDHRQEVFGEGDA